MGKKADGGFDRGLRRFSQMGPGKGTWEGLTRSGARAGQEVGGKSEVYPRIPGQIFADWDWGEAPEI